MKVIRHSKGAYTQMTSPIRFWFVVLSIAGLAIPVAAADSTQKAWDVLQAGLNDKSFTKRHDAVRAVELLVGDPKAVTIAEKALADPAPEVRGAGATALGQLHSTASIPKLKEALKDKEVSVVLAAAHSLWVLGDKEAFEVYYEILIGERKSSNGLVAGEEAMFRDRKKLAEFGFEQGIAFNPFASLGWGIYENVHKDDVSPVRAAAAKILADDSDPHSGQALVKACSDKSWIVRVAALDALARRGDPALIRDIEPHTTDEKDIVRYTAAAAIIRLSSLPPRPSP